jgi:hypothetical protein
MTFTLDPIYIYLAVNTILAVMLLLNIRKTEKLQNEVNGLWQQIAVMAVAASGAFTKLENKIDEKQTEK